MADYLNLGRPPRATSRQILGQILPSWNNAPNILHDVHDIDKRMPGAIKAIREYLRIYKVCTGAVENQFALRGEALNQEYAIKVIEETHEEWKQLRADKKREV